MKNINNIWKECVQSLSKEFSSKGATTLLKRLEVSYSESDTTLTINVRQDKEKALINHVKDDVERYFSAHLEVKGVKVVLQEFLKEVEKKVEEYSYSRKVKSSGLHPQYTFNNFIVGDSNREAHAAIQMFSKKKSPVNSPLILYGENGIGKTHLLCAAANYLDEHGSSVLYITTSDLMEMQNTQIRSSSSILLSEKFNSYDTFMLDDVQFLKNKTGATQIFFNTLDSFIRNNKGVVVVSDKRPLELDFFNERIRSRLFSGLVIRIETPNLETAIKIVKVKSKVYCPDLKLGVDVITYIAHNFSQDVRSIEGALKRLNFLSLQYLDKENIPLDFVKSSLKDLQKKGRGQVEVSLILKLIEENYNLSRDNLFSPSRKKPLSDVRHITIYLIKEKTDLSYAKIGSLFGQRDASTIKNSYDKIKNNIKIDKELEKTVIFLMKKINELLFLLDNSNNKEK